MTMTNNKNRIFRRILVVLTVALTLLSCIPVFADEEDSGTEGATTITVTSGAELDAAIKTAVGADANVNIVLANSIDAVTSATYTGYATGAKITIDGQGHKIDGQGVMDTGLRFGARSQNLDVVVKNTVFANMQNDDRNGGGAIAMWRGTLTVTDCTFVGNVATTGSRGGGGVMLQTSTGASAISNSTFINNSSNGNGGAIYLPGVATVNNITVANNSSTTGVGGVFGGNASTPLVATNSIIAGNSTASASADANVSPYVTYADGNNVVQSEISAWLAGSLNESNTLALLQVKDSPAIDKANPATATASDQRGVVRDSAPDIGAYELVKANVISIVANPDLNASGVSGVSVVANLAANNVNLVEATIKYNKSQVSVAAVSPVEGAAINKLDIDEEKGIINLVLGVAGLESIAFDGPTKLADIALTAVAGEEIGGSHISISSCALYAAGEVVEFSYDDDALYARFTYASVYDVNGDGVVDAKDLSLVLYRFGAVSTDDNWNDVKSADINKDNIVDMTDITDLVNVLYS